MRTGTSGVTNQRLDPILARIYLQEMQREGLSPHQTFAGLLYSGSKTALIGPELQKVGSDTALDNEAAEGQGLEKEPELVAKEEKEENADLKDQLAQDLEDGAEPKPGADQ